MRKPVLLAVELKIDMLTYNIKGKKLHTFNNVHERVHGILI